METLYWTRGHGGGLGSFIHNPKKKIWIGDYVHFDRIGCYRIHLQYRDTDSSSITNSKPVNYDLGNFFIYYLPENPVSKLLKQLVLASLLFAPSDEVRCFAVKWLGYQQTTISTFVIAKYSFSHGKDWVSTLDPYNNSLAETHRGMFRNYDYRRVGQILRGFESKNRKYLLADYFDAHFFRLIYPEYDPSSQLHKQAAQNEIKKLIEYTYVYLDTTSKKDFKKRWARVRELQTDEFWRAKITKAEYDLVQATNQTKIAYIQGEKKQAEVHLAWKKERDLRLLLIDYTLRLLEEADRKLGP